MQHWATPNDCAFLVFEQKPNAHQFYAMLFDRHDLLAVASWLRADPEQCWNARAINVRVEQANSGAHPGHRAGEVGAYGTLAHAALAAHDQYYVFDLRHRIVLRDAPTRNIQSFHDAVELQAISLQSSFQHLA